MDLGAHFWKTRLKMQTPSKSRLHQAVHACCGLLPQWTLQNVSVASQRTLGYRLFKLCSSQAKTGPALISASISFFRNVLLALYGSLFVSISLCVSPVCPNVTVCCVMNVNGSSCDSVSHLCIVRQFTTATKQISWS